MLRDFHCWAPLSGSPLPHHPVPLISVPSLIPTSSAPGRADLQQKIPHSGQNQLNLQQFVAGLCWDLSLKIIPRVGAGAPCNMGRDFPAPVFAEICLGSNYRRGRSPAPARRGAAPSAGPGTGRAAEHAAARISSISSQRRATINHLLVNTSGSLPRLPGREGEKGVAALACNRAVRKGKGRAGAGWRRPGTLWPRDGRSEQATFPSANAANYRRQLRAGPEGSRARGPPVPPGQPRRAQRLGRFAGRAWSARIHGHSNPRGWVLNGERHSECDFSGDGKIEPRGGSGCHSASGWRASTSLGTPSLSW